MHGSLAKMLDKHMLTLVKHWRVVVDVAQRDVDSSGACEPPQLSTHVFGLDDYGVVLPGFSVHVC